MNQISSAGATFCKQPSGELGDLSVSDTQWLRLPMSLSPLKTQQTQTWMRIGPTSKVELGIPTLFSFNIETQTGWISNTQEVSVYILSNDGRTYIAMSNICTHLGCHIRWIDQQEQFTCPCHNGVFDKLGNVVSGPPPRPLDRYDVKVENDQLYVLVGG